MASIAFSDVIVNATDLRQNQKHWLEKAYDNPITVSYGQKRLAIMNREQIGKLYTTKYYSELVLKACEEFMKELKSDTFPWEEYLTEKEKLEFHKELLTRAIKSIMTGDWTHLEHLIGDWKATAETERSPEIVKALQDRGTPEQYVTLK